MLEVREPANNMELEQLYDLRWRTLREPWNRPKGSERDELDGKKARTCNAIAVENGTVIGTARLHKNSDGEGQIRFMCVQEECRNRGVGKMMIDYLHEKARALGMQRIVANVRADARGFYLKNGYAVTGKAHTLFGDIPHVRMTKDLAAGS